jgi:hypothetical protein
MGDVIASSKDQKQAKSSPLVQNKSIVDTQEVYDTKQDKARNSIFATEGGSGGVYGERVSKRKTLFGN